MSLTCPWAHRTLIMRNLEGLADLIDVSVVHWLMGEDGWTVEPAAGVIPDPTNGAKVLHEIYTLSEPSCTSRVTILMLWDKPHQRLVCNESSDILRMFNSDFDGLGAASDDYYSVEHCEETDAVNARVYARLNKRRLSRRLRNDATGLRDGCDRSVRYAGLVPVTLVAPPRPVVDANHRRRNKTWSAAPSDDTQQGVSAVRHH